jgi:hypothetical protein
MAARQNALSELTRFWLEARHGCFVRESVPVPVPGNYSDIDFVVLRPDLCQIQLPSNERLGPRFIVESKDEHDFDPQGRDYGKRLVADVKALGENHFVPATSSERVRFTMLKQQHYDVAREIFGTEDFDRLFVVHALDDETRKIVAPGLREKRIHWVTVQEVLADLESWYSRQTRPAALRNTLVGDLFHLLFGYCKVRRST